jgi:hypothetical protein
MALREELHAHSIEGAIPTMQVVDSILARCLASKLQGSPLTERHLAPAERRDFTSAAEAYAHSLQMWGERRLQDKPTEPTKFRRRAA